MKSNVSKNAKTDRRKNEKLKFNGAEIEPVAIYGHSKGVGKILGVMLSANKELLTNSNGKLVLWDEVSFNTDEKR